MKGAGVERRCRRHRLAVIDSALLFCWRQNGRWRTVAMRDPPPSRPAFLSLLNPGQPRPQGAPIFCQRVCTLSSVLSEFWLNLNAKEEIVGSERCYLQKMCVPCDGRLKSLSVWVVNTCKNAESVFGFTTTLLSLHYCSNTLCLFLQRFPFSAANPSAVQRLFFRGVKFD